METIKVVQVVEYSQFYPDEDSIDIPGVLKTFDRVSLIKMATLLSVHYGNLYLPNDRDTLFSAVSSKYKDELNWRFSEYYKRIGLKSGVQVVLTTFRTSLELFRNIFAIKSDPYQSAIADEDQEVMLFKVILSLNERIMRYDKSPWSSLEKMVFINRYLNNDCNDFDFQSVMASQIHYFKTLIDSVETTLALKKATDNLLVQYGISSWQEYFATILYLAFETEKYRKNKELGLPIVKSDALLRNDTTGLISAKLLDYLSIAADEYIPYNEDNGQTCEGNNTDYRCFRSKPLIRLPDGASYLVTNIQLVCERLYNSLVFDLVKHLEGFDFNNEFVEKTLFRKTMFRCLDKDAYSYPSSCEVNHQETNGEPDFYVRKGIRLVVMECKAVKVNGTIRDKADVEKLLGDLKQKLACKTQEINSNKECKKPKLKGVGQLAKHIDSINKNTFRWDKAIPGDAVCYPVLVLEDPRILQPGLLKMLNSWFDEIIKEQGFAFDKTECRPVMAVSIHTLFLYDDLIRSKGLPSLIDEFLQGHAKQEQDDSLSPLADFDGFLRSKQFCKSDYIGRELATWLRNM